MRSYKIISIQAFLVCMLITFQTFGQDKEITTYELEEVTINFDTIPSDNYLLSVDDYMNQRNDLQVVKRGGFAFEPIIEGFTDGQIAVSIDGMRVFGACTDKMDPATSYLEPVNLKQLSVLKENESQMYGTALGGTLMAEMKYPDFKKPLEVGVQTAYSSNSNGFDGNVYVEKGITKKWAVRYSGAYRKHDSYTDGNNELVRYTQYEKMNHTFTSTYKISSDEKLTALLMYDHGKDIGYPALNMDVSSAKAVMGNVGYAKHYHEGFINHFEAKVYYNDITHVMDDTKRENVAMHMDMPGRSKTFGAWALVKKQMENHQLSLKGDFYSNHLFADMTMYSPTGGVNMYMLTWGDIQRNSFAFNLQDEWKLDPRLTLLTNARVEWSSTDLQNEMARKQFETLNHFIDGPRSDLSGSLSALFKYKLTSSIESKFGVSYTSRMPSASELYGFYLFNANDRFDYVGTPDLKNEKATSLDFSLRYHKESWQIGFRGKASFIDDYIVGIIDEDYDPMTIGALGVKRFQNVESATTSHLELFAGVSLSKQLDYNFNLVYENGYIDAIHSPMPYQRPLTLKNKLNYQFHKLTSSFYYEHSLGMQSPSEALGEQKTDPYHLINLDFSYPIELKNSHLFLELGVHNLLNSYYIDPFAWNGIPNSGRNIKTSIRFII
ncbi:TonB-dependent receptor plug domain-containing protein [Flammeovirga aprica]|uniref:TonB-dependent receptor n=1 Tax=Flammeovirga aprica JL-4 TaxID=694437 RepID=A0A7X9RUK7_9BACT|nr:TonB-dependent receptor [Flammeovirga aprica]NME68985.1 TonB-dependent receptor [Flammeovirga aprica JL-4]